MILWALGSGVELAFSTLLHSISIERDLPPPVGGGIFFGVDLMSSSEVNEALEVEA